MNRRSADRLQRRRRLLEKENDRLVAQLAESQMNNFNLRNDIKA